MTSKTVIDIKVIVGGMVGDMTRGIEDSVEDFGLETLDVLDVGWLR
jgi:galactitol-specific phosphotransferase system IIC component